MLRHSWLLLAALTVLSACGPEKPTPDGGTPAEDAGVNPACDDRIQNGDETGVDCGGSCATKCANGGTCATDTDCASGICSNGVCVECTEASQCPGSDTECAVRVCENNTCGVSNVPAGTPVAAQTEGDCQVQQCDGNGQIVGVNDDSDVPADDGNECTDEVCMDGVASHPPKAVNTACTQDGGAYCDGAGACVACNTADQCPGTDTECQTRTCTAGVCGFSYAAEGTPVSTQTPGDCQVAQCDGAGAVVSVADNSDLPVDDGIECTDEVCTAGVPSHPAKPVDTACSQNGGSFCDGAGACVACNTADQCPGTDTECQTRTCTAGVCGFSYAAAGTQVSAQTPGDCQVAQCDGAGAVVSVADNSDLPADDGIECTDEVCTAGVPSHPAKPVNTACNQNGGAFCDGAGACVACNTASQCPGTDTDCSFRTCLSNTCGMENVNAGVPVATQTPGDCQVITCDGSGGTATQADDTDVPADDGNQCTEQVCVAGVPSFPPSAPDTACNQNGGAVCDGAGACVGCTTASQCPGTDTECQTRTCENGACGFSYAAAGTVVSTQTAGDCSSNQCDGAGQMVAVADDTDVPADDGNECTAEVCTSGTAEHAPVVAGTPCSQNGGTVCDGAGACVSAPTVASTDPADSTTVAASTAISVTFSTAMDPSTLTAQTIAGACSGSVQVSADDFATCVAFASATATMSGGDTVATFTPAPGLLVNRTYKIRVTTAAEGASGVALASEFTQATGFTTLVPGIVVMSQVYGGGGNSGAPLDHDFVELHNRGAAPVSLNGMSLQYASQTGTTWGNVLALSGTIPPGGYFLVQLSGGSNGAALPTPDQTGSISVSGTNGKFALMATTTQNPNGACPPRALTLDIVGFGSANCFEGSAGTPALSNSTAALRKQDGCQDTEDNSNDFVVGNPAPRNSSSPPVLCTSVTNESNTPAEADYCNVQFPLSLSVTSGANTGSIYGRIFEAGVTEAGGASSSVKAQLGFGPETANPQYEPGWTWIPATFNVQNGNDDEYQASFNAPAPGSYRYAYRFSLDDGASWTYCDAKQGDLGAGSNPNLSFSLGDLPVLTVTP
ncbi:MAG: lamin tail domain-containing protein [Myxococcaceae bacterium]|nr:lamin tail domain-containing protein [Myxococcaceae bacterium]